MGTMDLFPLQKKGVLQILIALKNPSPLAGFKLMNLESNGKHANQ
jgi:hypothetical protein